ncbi:Transmembrane protein [Fasciola gigantica]|uniref:Transmembrane protein 186 n=1 Tax=Fasciola gigantica TaxID=46835 RepID=A0A504YKM3_FASGI|nr:Transmembrane protein [Fasciola gigantica]
MVLIPPVNIPSVLLSGVRRAGFGLLIGSRRIICSTTLFPLESTASRFWPLRPLPNPTQSARFSRTVITSSALITKIPNPTQSARFSRTVITSSASQSVNSRVPLKSSQIDHENPNDWRPIYRLTLMPLIQAVSRSKFLFTTILVLGTPFVIYAGQEGYVTSNFPVFFVGATVFSLGTLAAFSYFSTRLIGVVSIHKTSGLIRLGHLTFWGSRINTLLSVECLIPPADFADNPADSQTVRVGVLSESVDGRSRGKIQHMFFLTRIRAQFVDGDTFERLFGFHW